MNIQNIKEYDVCELNSLNLLDIKSNIAKFITYSFDEIRPIYEGSNIDISLYSGVIDSNPDRKFVLMNNDIGEILGCLVYYIKRNVFFNLEWGSGDMLVSEYIGISPNYQNTGLGSYFKKYIENIAGLNSPSVIFSFVHRNNIKSQNWNEKNGYTKWDDKNNYMLQYYKKFDK